LKKQFNAREDKARKRHEKEYDRILSDGPKQIASLYKQRRIFFQDCHVKSDQHYEKFEQLIVQGFHFLVR